jgi:hypothetical protein
LTEQNELHISMWDYNKVPPHTFMGYFVVPLFSLPEMGSLEAWYRLVHKPLHAFSELLGSHYTDKKKTKKGTTEGMVDLISIKEFVKICQIDASGK